MSHDHNDLNEIIIGKTLTATVNELTDGQAGSMITGKIMEEIGHTLVRTGQGKNQTIDLSKALYRPKQFADGSALFLFDQYREHLPYVYLVIDVQEDNTINVSSIKPNNQNMALSVIQKPSDEQKAEIIRQFNTDPREPRTYLYSAVLVSSPPSDYQFFIDFEAHDAMMRDVEVIKDETQEIIPAGNSVHDLTDSTQLIQADLDQRDREVGEYFVQLPHGPVMLVKDSVEYVDSTLPTRVE